MVTSLSRRRGQEMECLEENLEKLSEPCRKAVEAYAVGEAEEPTLNAIFVEACAPFWDEHCQVSALLK